MLCIGGAAICQPAETEANLYADGYKPPAGSKPKAVRVNPGTVLVQARADRNDQRARSSTARPTAATCSTTSRCSPAADITNPQQGFDEGAGGNGQPNVNFGFTSHGKSVFEEVTKEIAHRGQEAQLPGVSQGSAPSSTSRWCSTAS